MKQISSSRAVFALAVAAGLGFGATQAFASPARVAARACDPAACRTDCRNNLYSDGVCVSMKGSAFCLCLY